MPEMTVPAGERARVFFDDLWRQGDHWEFETSEFEQAKYDRQVSFLDGSHYQQALEIGCGCGRFTGALANLADHVLALDVSPAAIERSQAALSGRNNVECQVANIMEMEIPADGSRDLVVMSETIYYLGWLYPFVNVAWLAWQLCMNLRPGGRLLMANTQYGFEEPLMMPWLISTYRDLFLNVGFTLEREEWFRGVKRGVDTEVLISLFCKPCAKESV